MFISYYALLSAILLLVSSVLLQRKQRLSFVPGPFLASVTDLWRYYNQNAHRFTSILEEQHRRYGSIVRIGPSAVSFSDPYAVATIYNAHGNFRKADGYLPLRSAVNGAVVGSVIDIQDEDTVSQVKRAVGHIFSAKNVLEYEHNVDETCDLLLQAMRDSATFDLFAMMSRFQADFLLKIAFSDRLDFLKTGADSSNLSFEARYQHWMRWQGMPFLERMLFKTPFVMRYFKTKSIPKWARMAQERLQARLSEKNTTQSSPRQVDLLSKYLIGGEKRGDRLPVEIIPRMVSSTISAGFDTTAFTITAVIYYLCRNPSTMQALRTELAGANLTARPRYSETKNLKYLGAVIKEAMRLYPFLQLLMERVVPTGGAEICGKFFPAGTVVGCHPSITHVDSNFYGPDATEFRPDRWLVSDTERLVAMERASLGFGNGKRICLGRHLAEMEMMKVIPVMVMHFDIELMDDTYVLEPRDLLTSFPKPVQVQFRERKSVDA